MSVRIKGLGLALGLLALPLLNGCAAVTVASATVSVAATAVEVTADTVGFVADVAIPDGSDDNAE